MAHQANCTRCFHSNVQHYGVGEHMLDHSKEGCHAFACTCPRWQGEAVDIGHKAQPSAVIGFQPAPYIPPQLPIPGPTPPAQPASSQNLSAEISQKRGELLTLIQACEEEIASYRKQLTDLGVS